MFEGMFGLPIPGQEQRNEEKLLNKQFDASKEQSMLDNSLHPQTEMTYLEQNKEREDLVKWQQDLDSEIIRLIHDLKREYQDENGEWHLIPGETPACNDHCIQMIVTNSRPLLSRNMMMSSFSEDRILQMLKRTMAAIVRNLVLKYDYYEIDYFNISFILATIKNYIMPAPFRALNNGERKHLDTINRRIETYAETPQQKEKKSWFGS